jgi:exopolysaccharide biosynthesis polyprenyl glycosylphosphotransferase
MFKIVRWLAFFTAIIDFLFLQFSLLLGYWLWVTFPWHGHYQPFSEYAQILWALPFLGILIFKGVGLYKPQMGILAIEEQSLIFKGIWIIYFIGFAVSFFYRDVRFSRLSIFYSIFIAVLLISTERFFFRNIIQRLHEKGITARYAIIYGAGYHGQRLARWIRQTPKLGIQVTGYLDDDIEKVQKRPDSAPYLGDFKEEFDTLVAKRKISLLFIAHPKVSESKVVEMFQRCRDLKIQCWIIPTHYQFYIEKAQLTNIGGIPLIGFRDEFTNTGYLIVKRFCDMFLALFLLILTSPFALLIALSLVFSLKEPILFRQIRIGKGGKKFEMLKFRTLRSGPVHKDDLPPELGTQKQVNAVTAFLRRSGFDELPQLINVLKGEMSLVGPRPEMPFLVEKYGPLERERLEVKPGITGIWQISEDRKRLLIHENMDYDLYYVEHCSFNLDLAILLKTFIVVFRRIFDRQIKKPSIIPPS